MSVRRLAEDQFQPASFAFNAENSAWAEATIKKYPAGREQSAVIPLLMRAQEQDGWVTRAAIESIADMLGMAYIRVLEVATFYTQFQLKPVGTRAHVQVCGTTPCMLRGAEDLIRVCKSKIHSEPFHTNPDGTLSWEEVECAGACVNAPMVTIFKDTYEDLTPTQLEHIIDRFQAGRGADIKPGPQNDRVYSAPEGGRTTLLEDTGKPPKQEALGGPAAKPAAEEAPAAAVSVPPSNAAKPDTTAVETNPVLKTPSAGKKAAGEKAAKPSLDDPNRPKGVEKPAQPDDLELISGVGPKISGILHELGIFTYKQIAGWTATEREWVDGYLNFKGRIDRDDWVKQAEALSKGVDEYVRVFGKKPR